MQRITISRFTKALAENSSYEETDDDGNTRVEPIENHYSGVIEGERNDGTTWVMFIDADGSPELFWSERGPAQFAEDGTYTGGEVIGDPIQLQPDMEPVTVDVDYEISP